jgi:hypothetical protein
MIAEIWDCVKRSLQESKDHFHGKTNITDVKEDRDNKDSPEPNR